MIAVERPADRQALMVVPRPMPPVSTVEIALILALLIFYTIAQLITVSVPAALGWTNMIGPLALIAAMIYGVASALRRDPDAIWGAFFWFRVACGVYYGAGNLVALSSDQITSDALRGLYYFSEYEILKFNIIITCGVFFVYLGAIFTRITLAVPNQRKPVITIYYMMIIFLVVGGVARYGIILPFLLNLQEGILPSIVSLIAKAYSAGLMLLILLALQRRNILFPIAIVLVFIEIAVGVLLFNKSDVMITCLCVALAFYLHRPKISTLIAAVSISLFIFSTMTPLVGFGRNTLIRDRGNQSANLDDRLAIIQAYQVDGAIDDTGQRPTSLTRFSYVNVATFVISQYDVGLPTYTLANVAAVFIPRFLWPDKPNLTKDSTDLYTRATGIEGTAITAGLFAEAYGNFGWWGLPLLMTPYGIILALMSRAMSAAMGRREWALLPVALIGVQVGTRVDGGYVIDVIGAPVTLALFAIIIIAVSRVSVKT